MKKIIFAVLFMLIVSFAGCTPKNEELVLPPVDTKPQDEAVVDTAYYTVKIPENCCGSTIYKLYNEENPNYILSFYDKLSHEEFGGGRLFSIEIFDFEEDYTFLPSYKLLGYIITENDTKYNVVITYPTDVQFMPNTVESYKKGEEKIPEIIEKISFKETVEFVAE